MRNLDNSLPFRWVLPVLGSLLAIPPVWPAAEVSLSSGSTGFTDIRAGMEGDFWGAEVRYSPQTQVPVGGLQLPFLALGPLVFRGPLTLEDQWSGVGCSSELWFSEPGWKLGPLPREWTSGSLALGRSGGAGGFYVQGRQDRFRWGTYYWGTPDFYGSSLQGFFGLEAELETPQAPLNLPYGRQPDSAGWGWEMKNGWRWNLNSFRFQAWTWGRTGVSESSVLSGVFHTVWDSPLWAVLVLAGGSRGRVDQRGAFAEIRGVRKMASGSAALTLGWEPVWWMPGAKDAEGGWKGCTSGRLGQDWWELWSEMTLAVTPEDRWNLKALAGGKVSWEFLSLSVETDVRGQFKCGVDGEYSWGKVFCRAETPAGNLGWRGEAGTGVKTGGWEAAATVSWGQERGPLPDRWEASLGRKF